MWIHFRSSSGSWGNGYPFAVKVAAGKINAVTGKAWSNALTSTPQDYLVIPRQPWLDGFNASKDVVRQFVAVPLGQGVTAEEQITGEGLWGGLQLIFYPMKAEEYRRRYEQQVVQERADSAPALFSIGQASPDMGLAPGGRIKQEIAEDPYGIDVWDTSVSSRCFVHLLNAEVYRSVTGQAPPTQPITAKQYAKANVPWFDYYLEGRTLAGSSILAGLHGIAAALLKKGEKLDDNKPIPIAKTVQLNPKAQVVSDGSF
jgi:hypothetical protein